MSLDWPASDDELLKMAKARSAGTSPATPPAQKRPRRKRQPRPHRVHNHDYDPSCKEIQVKGKFYGVCILAEKTERALKLQKQREKTEENARTFKRMCVEAGLPLPVREYRFAAPDREWEADFCWTEERVCLEVEGGAWSGGRHTRGSGYLGDMEKYNQMTLRGYKLLRCTPSTLCTPETVEMIRKALNQQEAA